MPVSAILGHAPEPMRSLLGVPVDPVRFKRRNCGLQLQRTCQVVAPRSAQLLPAKVEELLREDPQLTDEDAARTSTSRCSLFDR